jgi:hypothetical protein
MLNYDVFVASLLNKPIDSLEVPIRLGYPRWAKIDSAVNGKWRETVQVGCAAKEQHECTRREKQAARSLNK